MTSVVSCIYTSICKLVSYYQLHYDIISCIVYTCVATCKAYRAKKKKSFALLGGGWGLEDRRKTLPLNERSNIQRG